MAIESPRARKRHVGARNDSGGSEALANLEISKSEAVSPQDKGPPEAADSFVSQLEVSVAFCYLEGFRSRCLY
jgi:hypothetical protein